MVLDFPISVLTLLHSEWPKLFGVLAILSAIGLNTLLVWRWTYSHKIPDELHFLQQKTYNNKSGIKSKLFHHQIWPEKIIIKLNINLELYYLTHKPSNFMTKWNKRLQMTHDAPLQTYFACLFFFFLFFFFGCCYCCCCFFSLISFPFPLHLLNPFFQLKGSVQNLSDNILWEHTYLPYFYDFSPRYCKQQRNCPTHFKKCIQHYGRGR